VSFILGCKNTKSYIAVHGYFGGGSAAGIEPGRYYLKKQLFLVFFL